MPTIRRCCIIGCQSNSRENPQLQFFQFPKPGNPFNKLWRQSCQASLSRILPLKKPVVCALHFHPQCIGGRRLVSSAVPSLRLEVPSNLKAVEQKAMFEEIERSRKCAFINAVVYEWLVRANLTSTLRGSITHGMIKEKAENAKQVIDLTSFIADNRWLHRFRVTHLAGFALKLASNQLKPLGPSLWIPDIVQDLQHLFPPTSADRGNNLENVPEHYIGYMQQYGEYDEDDSQQPQHHSESNYSSPRHSSISQSPTQLQEHYQSSKRIKLEIPDEQNGSEVQTIISNDEEDDDDEEALQEILVPPTVADNNDSANNNTEVDAEAHTVEDIETISLENNNANCYCGSNESSGSRSQSRSQSRTSQSNGSGSENRQGIKTNNMAPVNGGTVDSCNSSSHNTTSEKNDGYKELYTYADALQYLKPLEGFALCKENFRAITLIAQLEAILQNGIKLNQKFVK